MIRAWLQRRRRREELLVLGALAKAHPDGVSGLVLGKTTGLGPGVHEPLVRLESAGWVTSEWADGPWPRRRYYHIAETEAS